jgi:hypothetical protein
MDTLSSLSVDPFDVAAGLPEPRPLSAAFPHAPKRNAECLSANETLLALRNALRYVPEQWRTFAIACSLVFVLTRH